MIDVLLLSALVKRIEETVKEYRVEDERGILHPITVVPGFLPPKRTEQLEEYEKYCVLVRLAKGQLAWNKEYQQAEAITKTIIVVRTASLDVHAGPMNTLNLMTAIQTAIYSAPILDERFRATFPMDWEGPDGQSFPLWQGEMTIPWLRPMPQEICDTIGGMTNYG